MSAEADPTADAAPKKKGMMLPLLAGLVLAALGGGGGFWAVSSGPLSGRAGGSANAAEADGDGAAGHDEDGGDGHGDGSGAAAVAFVPLDTVTISLGPDSPARHLIFSAQLEVDPAYEGEVAALAPRILDVLNSYLRVVGVEELSDPTALARLRAQMLHRIQIVTGDGRVRDLLVTEFVVN